MPSYQAGVAYHYAIPPVVQNIAQLLAQCPPLPAELPVMVLTECYHLPGTVLPLCIFEQRYRDMLDHALSTSRMFCVGVKKDKRDPSPVPEIYPYATAGLIQTSVKNDDGTSNLLLLGLRRVRFTHWRMQGLFRVAGIEPQSSQAADTDAEKATELLRIIERSPHGTDEQVHALLTFLRKNAQPELTADMLAYYFVQKPSVLRKMLQQPLISSRLDAVLSELGKSLEHPLAE